MGKGIDKMVKNAADKTTGGCTLTLFKRAAAFKSQRTRGKRRASNPMQSIRTAHKEFESSGKTPFWVQNFVRGGHHLTFAEA